MTYRVRWKFLHRANGKYVWKAVNCDGYAFARIDSFWPPVRPHNVDGRRDTP